MTRSSAPAAMVPEGHQRGIAVVTAGASPLGRACVEALAREGHLVVPTWHQTPITHRPAVPCDVADEASVDAAFATIEADHGPIDVLVANAGIGHLTPLVTADIDEFRRVIDTTLIGAALCARAAARSMRRRRYGRIVLVGSVAGLYGPAGLSSYAAAKAGLIGLARSLAREVGPRGVTVNVVAPGLLQGSAVTDEDDTRSQDVTDAWVTATPLGRLGTFAEAASAVAFLSRPEASFVTGAVLPVDGGYAFGTT